MKKHFQIKCPTCGKKGQWFEGIYGPFCSKRCKLVDLGKWFGEEQVISQPLRPEDLEKFDEVAPKTPSEKIVR